MKTLKRMAADRTTQKMYSTGATVLDDRCISLYSSPETIAWNKAIWKEQVWNPPLTHDDEWINTPSLSQRP